MAKTKSFIDNPTLRFISKETIEAVEARSEPKEQQTTPNPTPVEKTQQRASRKEPIDRLKDLEGLKVYTLTEIEPVLGVSHRTLLTYIKTGKLKGVRLGGKWKVSGENLKRFINGD